MSKNKKLASLFSNLILIFFLLNSCVGSSSVGVFGSGVSIAFDPRTVGMQIDDSIMQKNLMGRLTLTEKKYLLSIGVKVLDGNIFLSGKVDDPEAKLKITNYKNISKEINIKYPQMNPYETRVFKPIDLFM